MSRIGKLPVDLPNGVSVEISSGTVQVKGPKGTLKQALPAHVDVKVEGKQLVVSRQSDMRQARANHGLTRALCRNLVIGVSTGFERKLEIVGVGYRAEVKGKNLVLSLGFSHPVEYAIPDGIAVTVGKDNSIVVSGIDKQRVGQVAADIRGFRKPDAYKGKGIRFSGEYVRIKAGKSAK